MNRKQTRPRTVRSGALAAAVLATLVATPVLRAETSHNTNAGATQNGASGGQNNNAVTITLSGSTALKNFTTSPYITLLNPGSSITLPNGIGGALTTYSAPSGATTSVQLGSANFTAADSASLNGSPVTFPYNASTANQANWPDQQNNSAIRLEWHEQGSVEGVLEMVNDQIGYAGGAAGTPLIPTSLRNPVLGNSIINAPGSNTKFSNPVWVNGTTWDGTSAAKVAGSAPRNGFNLSTAQYNTYSNTSYNLATGQSVEGGMNRVQMAISDVLPIQGFSVPGAGSLTATPGTAGYGQGNAAAGLVVGSLPTNGPAIPGSSWKLQATDSLNMKQTTIDPQTGAAYAPGAWNSAGLGNLTSRSVAVTATMFVANPGTGLVQLNRTDAQWLQTTGRLSNGATFNMTTRDVGSGTRNVAALSTGIDPTLAVGVNDSGNGYNLTAGQDSAAQLDIGSQMKFSNKSSGGGQLRPTVQNNRMAVGTLGLSDAVGFTVNTSTVPLRALSYSDSTDGSKPYVAPGFSTITDGSYAIWQTEQYVTVNAPNANYGTANPDIKGDNQGSVKSFIANIQNTVAGFPSSSIANPADGLLNKGFVLPEMMQVKQSMNGVGTTSSNLPQDGGTYNDNLRQAVINTPSYNSKFANGNPTTVTSGAAGATYGLAGDNQASFNGTIPITSANYLFGNFNQNGVRDFSAIKTALYAEQALRAGPGVNSLKFDSNGNALNAGGVNSTNVVVPSPSDPAVSVAGLNAMNGGAGATKGDLIVLGDLAGSGRFDGQSLYLMAHNAALSDSSGAGYTNGALTAASGANLDAQIRNGVLRKNDALTYLDQHIAQGAPERVEARAAYTTYNANGQNPVVHNNDPNGVNAFNKFDVNRDGNYDRTDASIVDHFLGSNYATLTDALSATLNQDRTLGTNSPTTLTIPFNLVDAKLIDGAGTTINSADLQSITSDLITQGKLLAGDANFDGHVDFNDFLILQRNFGHADMHWSTGNFVGDPTIDFNDFLALQRNFGHNSLTSQQAAEVAAFAADPTASVPEPASLALAGFGALGLLARRRRSAR
ncbi:MAG: hypothetical protein JWP03_5255 [Phycisphaerales bacterium]|nr:hypothetical protein [Phycisphaerales bacterium]